MFPPDFLEYDPVNRVYKVWNGTAYAQISGTVSGTVQPGTVVIPATTYGLTPAVGVVTSFAPADHSHGSPSLGTTGPTTSGFGDVLSLGTGTLPALWDHRHGREAGVGVQAGSVLISTRPSVNLTESFTVVDDSANNRAAVTPQFGTSVVSETTYGQAPVIGTSPLFSPADHSHGSPSLTTSMPTTSAFGDAPTAGSGTVPAVTDHRHGREAGITVQSGGVNVGIRPIVNFAANATVADNPSNNRVDVTPTGAGGATPFVTIEKWGTD